MMVTVTMQTISVNNGLRMGKHDAWMGDYSRLEQYLKRFNYRVTKCSAKVIYLEAILGNDAMCELSVSADMPAKHVLDRLVRDRLVTV